jgi:hypothetical protein
MPSQQLQQLQPLDEQVADQLVQYAITHMQTQVGQVVQTQAALSQLWQSVLRPNDLATSFTEFTLGAEVLIQAARSRGQITAQAFYQASRALAGIDAALPTIAPADQQIAADLAALYSTGLATAQKLIIAGQSSGQALTAAQAAVLRAAQRRILDAPRQRLIDLSNADSEARGWARVGDGDPCYFCAMLIGRGPVYTEATAFFSAHDGCGCSARPVFRNDPSGGWTSDSRALHDAWRADDPETGHPGSYDWRGTYKRLRADPTSSVSRAIVAPTIADFRLAA